MLYHQVLLKVNGTYQLLAYADDVNLLGDNTETVKKNTETLIDASKYMLLSCYLNADQNWDIKIANRSFENVLQFKYLGMTVANQNLI
jgi:hypothetical protein